MWQPHQLCCQEDVRKLMQEKVVHLQPIKYIAQMYNLLLLGFLIVLIKLWAHFRLSSFDEHAVLIKAEQSELCWWSDEDYWGSGQPKWGCRPGLDVIAIKSWVAIWGHLLPCTGVAILYSCFYVTVLQCAAEKGGTSQNHYLTAMQGSFNPSVMPCAGIIAMLYMITIIQQENCVVHRSTHHVMQGNCNPTHIRYHTTSNRWFTLSFLCASRSLL